MQICDMRDFLAQIESSGELHRIAAEVDPVLEMAAIVNRVSKLPGGGPALVFDNIKGKSFRVAANLFGSEKRVANALGRENFDDLTGWFSGFISDMGNPTAAHSPENFLSRTIQVDNDEAQCRQVVRNCTDLDFIPAPKCWPMDGEPDHDGKFITLPQVITRSAEKRKFNCGMYRVAILGKSDAAIHWNQGSGAARHASTWLSAAEPMPVAIALGGPPALTFASILPLPEDVDEFDFTGMLQGAPLKVVKCLTSDLVVPAGAELVIEGFVDPGAKGSDGAFGNHTGYYQIPALSPLVRVTAIYHRKDMIYPTTVVGPPPMEDCCLAAAASRLLLAVLRSEIPQVVSIHQPLSGIFHGGTIISVSASSLNGQEVMGRIRSNSWLKGSRLIVLVDAEQDPADIPGVYWRVLNNTDWGRDMKISGKLLCLDATAKEEDRSCNFGPMSMDRELLQLVDRKWREYGFNHE